ncbi:hypothetical protein BX600DRAFT_489680 [Xylariales sp. PMI_506]|nr:hypothetical protein BX600DRAFT_489680 [Xylariales sp. PMI_506]
MAANDEKESSTSIDYDVIIIGAGISGINAAYRLQTQAPPGTSYAIVEGRESLGGTWDLFRYPGIRSDSDVYTFGFPWSPWDKHEPLATGPVIKEYMTRSARVYGIDKHILYRHKVTLADWSSETRCWSLTVDIDETRDQTLKSRFIVMCTGYYDYETPLQTTIPGIENFEGTVVHPQFWPEDLDYSSKNVVIIGSGATAITLLPSILDKAKHVTMLQRSPSYVVSLQKRDSLTSIILSIFPLAIAGWLNRILWVTRAMLMVYLCKRYPVRIKKAIKKLTIDQLPPGFNWDPHFKPAYNPWDQRLCVCKHGDFFAAIRSGRADVVTDKIRQVTKTDIMLESGAELQPDVIVTATGLKIKFGGGISIRVDGEKVDVPRRFVWKGAMLQDVPNAFIMTGYINASWTLGADASAQTFLRVLKILKQKSQSVAVPRNPDPEHMPMRVAAIVSSTYLKTALDVFPKGGTGQWSPKTNYLTDICKARWGDMVSDLEFA